jgi:hypothetical protein
MDEEINELTRRYDALQPGDPARPLIGFELGKRRAARFVRYGGAPEDRDRGIELLEEALDAGCLSGDDATKAHAGAGLLRGLRILPVPPGADLTDGRLLTWAAEMADRSGLGEERVNTCPGPPARWAEQSSARRLRADRAAHRARDRCCWWR